MCNPWIIHGQPMGNSRATHELPMSNPLSTTTKSRAAHGLPPRSHEQPNGSPWVHGNPIGGWRVLPVGSPRDAYGFPVGTHILRTGCPWVGHRPPWVAHGPRMNPLGFPWVDRRLPTETFHGFPVETAHDLSIVSRTRVVRLSCPMVAHGLATGFPWIAMGCPSVAHGLPTGCPSVAHGLPINCL